MLSTSLQVLPYKTKINNKPVLACKHSNTTINYASSISFGLKLKKPDKKFGPFRELKDISQFVADFIEETAYKMGISVDTLLRRWLKMLPKPPNVPPVISKTAIIGNNRVKSLIDGDQIFDQTLEVLKSAEKSIQIEMFEFQNLTVDGDKWVQHGAEALPAAKKQQDILWMLLNKKRQRPEMKIQVILDSHKWYINSYGKHRHFGNQDMIKYLKERGIDVVPYPRQDQQGATLQHIKKLIVDKKKAIIGGMNWGSHSAANHDACVSIEKYNNKKPSEIDNLIEEFNKDWKFSWKTIADKEFVPGPLSKEEQKFYKGLNKEIKKENVDYYKLLYEFYNTPEAKTRYANNKLELLKCNPVKNPTIKVITTKPYELKEVGEKGSESTRNTLMEKVKTCKKMVGELFVLSDKELVDTIIKRFKTGELDAKFLISSDILEFPYCRMPYHRLLDAGVPVRIYKTDKSIGQRQHSKWAVFDDKEIMIGSTNWSTRGMAQNLSVGFREDYELTSEKIEKEMAEYLDSVSDFEDELGIPNLKLPTLKKFKNYVILKKRIKKLKNAVKVLESGKDNVNIAINGNSLTFYPKDSSTINTIQGYYSLIKKRFNAQEKYKRGNNEISLLFESPKLAKQVFLNQFFRDWNYSESKYEKMQKKIWSIEQTKKNLNLEG